MATATGVSLILQVGTSNTLIATWAWNNNNTDNYKIQFQYYTGNKDSSGKPIWIMGEDTTTTLKQATYDAPSNAKQVRFRVKPIAKKHEVKKNNKKVKVAYWTADWSTLVKYYFSANPPDMPSAPNISLDRYRLTASVNVSDSKTKKIEFLIVKNDQSKVGSGIADVKTLYAAFSCNVDAGEEYKAKCRGINSDGLTGQWSEYSNGIEAVPSTPSGFISVNALSSTEVQLHWEPVASATSYVIEYTLQERYFNSSPENVKSVTITDSDRWAEITGLEAGSWWFRIQAVNSSGSSSFCHPVSIVIGKKPAAPTTWSLKSTVEVGEDAILYWVHNSEDGSSQVGAQVELTVNGSVQVIDVQNSQSEDEKDRTSSLKVSTTSVSSGGIIYWRVRTKGVTNEYGDWSIQRSIKVYAPATITLNQSIPSVLTSYPLSISVTAAPQEQSALRFFVAIIANEAYESVNYDGTSKWISENEEIYSHNFIGKNNALAITLTPSDVTFANNISYTLKVSAAMDSGMSPELTETFAIGWSDDSLEPDASLGFEPDSVAMFITPFCLGNVDSELKDSSGNTIQDSMRSTISTLEHDVEIINVSLSVYRREFDGTFTLIADGLPGSIRTTVTDPHPALDMARYRIVAVSNSTGAIGYTDIPGYEIGEVAAIIQWNEEWTNFDASEDDGEPAWSGSLLRLPYNLDVSDNYSPESSLVEYIGREHPVSYYGTQRGSTSTWNMEIDRKDDETLYALRRLAVYRGDIYVREPSGSGYWANVKVSFSSKHCEVTIPVTLNITRVEGGV